MLKCLDAEAQFIVQDSVSYLRTTPERFDFVFVDGCHEAATIEQELLLLEPLLRPGALVLLHDFFPDGAPLWSGVAAIAGPWQAVTSLIAKGLPVRAWPLGTLPWPTKRGTPITSLAVLSRG